jgi:hypothetical protein
MPGFLFQSFIVTIALRNTVASFYLFGSGLRQELLDPEEINLSFMNVREWGVETIVDFVNKTFPIEIIRGSSR